jgi:hypothetical protein
MDEGGAKRTQRVSYEEAEDEGGGVTRHKLHAGSPGALATPATSASHLPRGSREVPKFYGKRSFSVTTPRPCVLSV